MYDMIVWSQNFTQNPENVGKKSISINHVFLTGLVFTNSLNYEFHLALSVN